jgi:hypothetical protein
MNSTGTFLKKHPEIILCAILCLAFTSSFSHAQTKGGIRGRVIDSGTLEKLEGATISVLNQPWGGYTDKEGEYRIFNLTPGTYDIKVSLIGYTETTIQGIKVRSGQVYVQNVQLRASPIELEGTVIEASRVPILQPDVTESRQTVSDQEIRELPVDNIEDIIELQSGVINGTIRGGRIGQEVYVIDGVAVKNFLEGSQEGLGVDMGVLTVQELSLVTSGFSAEYGQALSGVINLVTKEGGTSHESALRITSDALLPEENEYGYNRLEVSMGGPLDNDKKFRYFFSADGIGRMDTEPVSLSLELTDGRTLNRLPHNEGDDLNLFGKLSYWATKDLKLSWSLLSSRDQRRFFDPHYKYNLENTLSQRTKGSLFTFAINRINSSSSARANILDARISLYRNDRYLGVLEEGYFDNRSDLFGFSLSDYSFRGEDFINMDSADQFATGGVVPGYDVPEATGENAYGVQDTSIFVDSGQNPAIARTRYEFVNVGVDWDNRFEDEFAIKTGGELKLNHTQTYQRLNAYQPGGVPNFVEFYPLLGSSYVQGQITSPGLVLDLGLRFDMFLPRINYPEDIALPSLGIRSSENKIALNPRLGTTIMITENNLFRINYGVFRQTPDFQYLFDIAFTDPLRRGNRRRGNPELQFEKTTQYEFAYSRAFTDDFSITGGVYVKQLENLVASRTTDLSSPQNARFANDDFGSVRGVEFVMRKRMGSTLGFTTTYTYQEAIGMVSDAFDLFSHVVFDPFSQYVVELGDNEFPLDFDQRHTANISVETRLPSDWSDISPLMIPFSDLHMFSTLEYGSGLPFTKMKIDTTVIGGIVTESLIPNEVPNASRLPYTLELNLRLSRGFELGNREYTVFADVRNLLNRQNVLYYDPWTDEPWNSAERLRRLAQNATEDALIIPAESPDYTPQTDLNGDRVITPDEQEEAYYLALVDRWSPVLSFDEPRQIRFGLDIRF